MTGKSSSIYEIFKKKSNSFKEKYIDNNGSAYGYKKTEYYIRLVSAKKSKDLKAINSIRISKKSLIYIGSRSVNNPNRVVKSSKYDELVKRELDILAAIENDKNRKYEERSGVMRLSSDKKIEGLTNIYNDYLKDRGKRQSELAILKLRAYGKEFDSENSFMDITGGFVLFFFAMSYGSAPQTIMREHKEVMRRKGRDIIVNTNAINISGYKKDDEIEMGLIDFFRFLNDLQDVSPKGREYIFVRFTAIETAYNNKCEYVIEYRLSDEFLQE